MLRLNDLMAVCVQNLPLVILLMLSPLRNESENENKINQNSSVNSYILYIEHLNNQNMLKRLGFLIFFTKIYKVCIDICITCIYVLQDSCNLNLDRGVGL